ncbi:ABC transporter permease [Marivibrio halodurans]|uniref:ABC transporter permease n=1 Tax=Marivibrio halodurans TaxID=2039722 RepID=A0A8J7SM28_9PROT|nr:ABC transporter permease [Marivibrio halodurans]MBP5856656.1 ABC transporter permease [Marivibrio halodurans]
MSAILTMIGQRLALGLLTLWVVTMIIFLAVELLPGDFAQALLGQSATDETVNAIRQNLGLDKPAVERYFIWLGDVLQGDFGRSLASERQISELVGPRVYNTLFLAAYAACIAVPIALTLGILAALYRNSAYDRGVNVGALAAISSPEFFAAYILVYFFAVQNAWFPSIARLNETTTFTDRLYMLFLPAVTLTLVTMAHMMRMTRAAIINLMASPYIEMARLKGIPRGRIIVRHALPNALSPIINVVAINLAYLIVGVVVVEVVFAYPGLGQLFVDSVVKRDMPVVQASALVFAVTYILMNLSADILSILSNPRLLHPR